LQCSNEPHPCSRTVAFRDITAKFSRPFFRGSEFASERLTSHHSDGLCMETSRLLKFQHPNRAQSLLESLSCGENLLPRRVRRLTAVDDFPAALKLRATHRCPSESAWLAWTDGRRIWFFVASPSLALSREHRKPVLTTSVFDESGSLTETANWVFTEFAGWQKCA
jgi:hypothetical protein